MVFSDSSRAQNLGIVVILRVAILGVVGLDRRYRIAPAAPAQLGEVGGLTAGASSDT
jgi:hypothetical protein